jgi:hypothetical protein
MIRIVGKQFMGTQFAIGRTTDNIGKRAPTVDPEMPLTFTSRCFYYFIFTHLPLHL